MKRILIVFVVGAMQVGLLAGLAQAQVSSFLDDFNSFDSSRWTESNHNLGRSRLGPNNVDTDKGNLRIKIPAKTLNGGEILSNDLYQYGSYSTRMKVPDAPSSITGFFLYQPPDYQSEIDVEIYNDSSRKIMFTTYAGGSQTHTQTLRLPFDPTNGFHEYRFDYTATSLKFYADGQLMKEWNDGLPQNSMKLYVNTWFPSWLQGRQQSKDKFTYVDSISYKQLP